VDGCGELAGDLKVAEAAPILAEQLKYDHRVATSFGADSILSDDPVAWSLSLIGEPATDSVAGLFADGDAPTRRRAAIVLSNIGTPNAREALLRQIDREPDPDLKTLMKSKVTSE
jgi:HEAT repeat protein